MTIEDILKIDPNAEIENGYTTKEAFNRADKLSKIDNSVKIDKVYLDIMESSIVTAKDEYFLFANEEDAKIYALLRNEWLRKSFCDEEFLSDDEYESLSDTFDEMIIFQTDNKSLMEKFINDNCLNIIDGFHFCMP